MTSKFLLGGRTHQSCDTLDVLEPSEFSTSIDAVVKTQKIGSAFARPMRESKRKPLRAVTSGIGLSWPSVAGICKSDTVDISDVASERNWPY